MRAEFRAAGVSQREWAERYGFKYQTVRDVLTGKSCWDRGEAHRVAVALGLKPDPAELGIDLTPRGQHHEAA